LAEKEKGGEGKDTVLPPIQRPPQKRIQSPKTKPQQERHYRSKNKRLTGCTVDVTDPAGHNERRKRGGGTENIKRPWRATTIKNPCVGAGGRAPQIKTKARFRRTP
jgi:hypothetical protein